MNPCLKKLKSLRSQKEAGLEFNFVGAVYTIIQKTESALDIYSS